MGKGVGLFRIRLRIRHLLLGTHECANKGSAPRVTITYKRWVQTLGANANREHTFCFSWISAHFPLQMRYSTIE